MRIGITRRAYRIEIQSASRKPCDRPIIPDKDLTPIGLYRPIRNSPPKSRRNLLVVLLQRLSKHPSPSPSPFISLRSFFSLTSSMMIGFDCEKTYSNARTFETFFSLTTLKRTILSFFFVRVYVHAGYNPNVKIILRVFVLLGSSKVIENDVYK